ncbi:MAG TPA: DUF4038 domain-containing protein, partial [Chryseolinea sp.]|nr:DUF4038 domain-containing protein [Chryseolinea sp.]
MSKDELQTNGDGQFLIAAVARWLRLISGYQLFIALCFTITQTAHGQSRDADLFKGPSVDLRHGRLKVSTNGRYLEHEDGTPFFWLGDTAWELFHRLTRDESDLYLEDRRSKGFTVIQAVVLADLEGLSVANANGHTPLKNNDPSTPDEAYFKDVDYVVDRAESLGMFIGLLPTWGDKFNKKWGFGPEIFTPDNAKQFGRFLGQRYREKPIIWILGGDRIPETKEHYAIIRAMAEGLAQGDANSHLMTYHPWGETS